MLTLKLIYNIFLVIISFIIWIPARIISFVLTFLGIIQIKIFTYRRIIPLLFILFTMVEIARETTISSHIATSRFDIEAIILFFKVKIQDGSIAFDRKWIGLVIFTVVTQSKLITHLCVHTLDLIKIIRRPFLKMSKFNMSIRIFHLRKAIKAKKNKGLYNIKTFKKQYEI